MLNDFEIVASDLDSPVKQVFVHKSMTENRDVVFYNVYAVDRENGKILFEKSLFSTFSLNELDTFLNNNQYQQIG